MASENLSKPFVSVVIPAYNAEKILPGCLNSLRRQSFPRENYEIIVIDDGSSDRTAEVAEHQEVTCKTQVNQGPASARNKGVAEASGDIVLFTDSDCVPDRYWIEEMSAPFEDPEVVAVKGAYKTKQKQLAARFAQAEFEDRYDLLNKSAIIDMIDTYSAGFRKDVFLRIGGFDESFPCANNEDTDLSYRLASKRYKMIFNPRAFVYHTHPDTLIKYLRVKFWRGYWRMVVYKRYPEKAMSDSYTPQVIKVQTLLMAASMTLLICSLFSFYCLYIAALLWGSIMLSSIPFSFKTIKKDKMVGIVSPLFILFRAVAFALGSVLGSARCLFSEWKKRKES